MPEGRIVKNRVHLDLGAADAEAEARRLTGARRPGTGQAHGLDHAARTGGQRVPDPAHRAARTSQLAALSSRGGWLAPFTLASTGHPLTPYGGSDRIADGDHHADVAIRELSLAKMAQSVEEPGNRHHHAVLRADPALNRIEVSAGDYQLRCPLR